MQTGDLVNLNDLVDWAMILAVAFYLVAVVATELIRSLEATMRKRERRRRRQPHLQSGGRRAGRYALDVDAGLRAARRPHAHARLRADARGRDGSVRYLKSLGHLGGKHRELREGEMFRGNGYAFAIGQLGAVSFDEFLKLLALIGVPALAVRLRNRGIEP
jgi:hypothetical protein